MAEGNNLAENSVPRLRHEVRKVERRNKVSVL